MNIFPSSAHVPGGAAVPGAAQNAVVLTNDTSKRLVGATPLTHDVGLPPLFAVGVTKDGFVFFNTTAKSGGGKVRSPPKIGVLGP